MSDLHPTQWIKKLEDLLHGFGKPIAYIEYHIPMVDCSYVNVRLEDEKGGSKYLEIKRHPKSWGGYEIDGVIWDNLEILYAVVARFLKPAYKAERVSNRSIFYGYTYKVTRS